MKKVKRKRTDFYKNWNVFGRRSVVFGADFLLGERATIAN